MHASQNKRAELVSTGYSIMISSVLPATIPRNCKAITRNYVSSSVTMLSYYFSIVVTHNYAVIFRNYGSQCDRSYGVTTSLFHRNGVHGEVLHKKSESYQLGAAKDFHLF